MSGNTAPDQFCIVVDTREQLSTAYEYPGSPVERKKLSAGDYSVKGLEDYVAVERKTLDDLVHTLIHQWQRFEKELEKLKNFKYKTIIIETSYEDLIERRYTSRAHPNAILGKLRLAKEKYHVSVYFAGNREAAAAATFEYLREAFYATTKKEKTENKRD
jgi:ERCC4-type nuclease